MSETDEKKVLLTAYRYLLNAYREMRVFLEEVEHTPRVPFELKVHAKKLLLEGGFKP